MTIFTILHLQSLTNVQVSQESIIMFVVWWSIRLASIYLGIDIVLVYYTDFFSNNMTIVLYLLKTVEE